MSLESSQVQRLSSLVAAMEPKFDEIARSFFDHFSKACPAAKSLRPSMNRRARCEFAASVAMVMKNLGRLDAASAVFEYARQRCGDAGIRPADMQIAGACLMSVMREAAGPNWSNQIESDCQALMRECMSRMKPAGSMPRREAA
ncbi:MAG: globin domain-containing protein [Phycisphaerales bacterium]